MKMYAAHAEQVKKETSQQHRDSCLALLREGTSDDDTFAALLTITRLVRNNCFTELDRKNILEAAGLGFLIKLVKSKLLRTCPHPGLYTSAILSFLSCWTVEPYIARLPDIRELLDVVNDVISPDSCYNEDSSNDSCFSYKQMCRDVEEIVCNLAKHELGVEYLIQSQTLKFMFEYACSSSCQDVTFVLASLSAVVQTRGENVLNIDPDTFYTLMTMAVSRLEQTSVVEEKIASAKILTSFLTGVATIEINAQMDWVIKLVQVLHKLIRLKLAPDDCQAFLSLVCVLVSTAGPHVFNYDIREGCHFLKTVVAHISVEVYMLLDCINLNNVSDRYSQLDSVYKLLTTVVQFVAETGESIDFDSMIVIYRKLVNISETIMEFLSSVANQQIQFQRNHTVVLISVRTLAAMLSEMTEDATVKLVQLLPFFNLLCQNVEYSDEVVMEVRNAAQAALVNIKLMDMDGTTGSAGPALPQLSCIPEHTVDKSSNQQPGLPSHTGRRQEEDSETADQVCDTLSALANLQIEAPSSNDTTNISDFKTDVKLPTFSQCDDAGESQTQPSTLIRDSHLCPEDELCENNSSSCVVEDTGKISDSYICLSQKNIDNYASFLASTKTRHVKPQHLSRRKVSFLDTSFIQQNSQDSVVVDQWKPAPNDVLGYLLPAYMLLSDNQIVLEVMVESQIFLTIVNFLKTSLSDLLEGKSSDYPESTTINCLTVVEQVYTSSPPTAAQLECFQELFEVCLLSLPNLLSMSEPPATVCLKLLEVTLSAYRLQMRETQKKSSLARLKHSQSRLFKAGIEYLSTFYEIHQHKNRSQLLDVSDVWTLVGESWCGCVAGLCTLVRSVEDLQDALTRSDMLPEFLSYLANCDDLSNCSDDVERVVQSMISLIETAAEGSPLLLRLIIENQGQTVIKKFSLHKLETCVHNFLQQTH